MAFSPDGSKVLTASLDGTAKIWDVATGNPLYTLAHGNSVISAAFNRDGDKAITGSEDNTAKIWLIDTGKLLHTLPHNDGVAAVAFIPDGNNAITGSYDHTAKVWDVDTGKCLCTLQHGNRVTAVAFSPDGKPVTASADSTAILWNLSICYFLENLNILQFNLLDAFSLAIKESGQIIATPEQWYIFETFPHNVQEVLRLFIKQPHALAA